MQGKSKQIYLRKESFPYDCQPEIWSSCGDLWQGFSQPLMWHMAVYYFLMTLFYTILFPVLFNNIV